VLYVSQFATGQNSSSIHGVVTDPTGAVIVGAAVEIQMENSGIAREVLTDDNGRYQVTGLALGQFSLRITAAGFQRAESTGELRSTSPFVRDVRLAVAGVSSSTNVLQRLLIEANESSSRHNFNAQSLRDLPQKAASRGMTAALKTLP